MHVIPSFWQALKGALLYPQDFFSSKRTEVGVQSAFIFYVLLGIVYVIPATILSVLFSIFLVMIKGILSGPMETLFGGTDVIMAAIAPSIGVFVSWILIWANAGITHLVVKLFGSPYGYGKTFQAVVYSSTPSHVLGWIPLVSWVIWIYDLVLLFFGLRELHRFSDGKAIGVIAVLIGLWVLLIMLFLMFFLSMIFFASFSAALAK